MAIEPLTPERRRRQTREYLLQAAEQVFATRGFHGASLDEVAAVAGFTKGAVYSNFKNKEDLFLALMEFHAEQQMDALRSALAESEVTGDDDLGRFAALIRSQFSDWGTWGRLSEEFRLYAMRNDEARAALARKEQQDIDAIAQLIEAERKRHGYDIDEPPVHLARIVVALTSGLFGMRLIDPDAVDDALVETTLSFIARAMTPPGRPSGDKAPTVRSRRRTPR
ncbi:MAG TPA: TetR/AcrR family transcriptional regulator [Acidimicrobiales bacterium]|nr:TetR/AcrR family transcriptional regulator [Acidimicrobiales bacterium]